MMSAWFGGAAVGLTAVVLSTLAVAYFFVPPLHSFGINPTDEAYFASFVICAVVASVVSSSKRNTEVALYGLHVQRENSKAAAQFLAFV
jgi:K+-sensing histidine kinase KdpD